MLLYPNAEEAVLETVNVWLQVPPRAPILCSCIPKAEEAVSKTVNVRAQDPTGTYKEQLLEIFTNLDKKIKEYANKPIENSLIIKNLYARAGKPEPIPKRLPDLLSKDIRGAIINLNSEYPVTVYGLDNNLSSLVQASIITPEEKEYIYKIAKEYLDIWRSNNEELGLPVEKNRRQNIYKRIIDKYFSNDK